MNKTQLIDTLSKETKLTRTKSEQIVELFFDEMTNALAAGERVEIRGLCSIYVKDYKGFTGRNPKTGEPIKVPAKKLPYFKCGKELKDRVDYRSYFAYGSNVDVAQMDHRCPGAVPVGVHKLPNHRFIINSRGVSTVVSVPDGSKNVYGVLWSITKPHEDTLDEREGVEYGTYRKEWLLVEMQGADPVSALIYVAADDIVGAPRAGYMEKIVAAAELHGLPPEYIEELKTWLPN